MTNWRRGHSTGHLVAWVVMPLLLAVSGFLARGYPLWLHVVHSVVLVGFAVFAWLRRGDFQRS